MAYTLPTDDQWHAPHNVYGLTQAQRQMNAKLIRDFFLDKGWTLQAIAGVVGNCAMESGLNPNIWQGSEDPQNWQTTGKGFGLSQWTPARVYLNWAGGEKYSYSGFSRQLECWYEEYRRNPTELNMWLKRGGYTYSYREYATDQSLTADECGRMWCVCYLRPGNPDLTRRGQTAASWYNWFIQHPEPSPDPTPPGPTPPGPTPTPGVIDPKITILLLKKRGLKYADSRFL